MTNFPPQLFSLDSLTIMIKEMRSAETSETHPRRYDYSLMDIMQEVYSFLGYGRPVQNVVLINMAILICQ